MQCVCTHVCMTVHNLISFFFSFLFSLNLSICLSNYVTALSQNSPHCQKYWIEICSKHKHEIPSLNFGLLISSIGFCIFSPSLHVLTYSSVLVLTSLHCHDKDVSNSAGNYLIQSHLAASSSTPVIKRCSLLMLLY